MSRIGIVVAALAVVGGCSGSGPQAYDGSALGTPYTCAGFFVLADGGKVPGADGGSEATCVVGQSFCAISLPYPGSAGMATAGCSTSPPCAQDPTCACLCDLSRGQYHCSTECRCSETGGLATVSCQGI